MDKKKDSARILLIEDDLFLSNIYKVKFEMEGLKVFTAEDGEDGISQAKKKHPNIILLDTLLSKLDGFSVLENLKNDPKTKNIPVILLTNLGQKDEVEKGFKLGAVDYLIKAHFKPSEIITKIKKILNLN